MGEADGQVLDDVDAGAGDPGAGAPAPSPAPAAPAPAPAGKAAGSAPVPAPAPDAGAKGADGGAAGTPADEVKPIWPDDWRTQAAGGDDKTIAKLGRYASPSDVAKALIQLQDKISKGELRANLGSDASDEQKAAFRKELGIPETPDGYEVTAVTKDSPIVKAVLAAAHGSNATPQQVAAIVNAYVQAGQGLKAEEETRSAEARKQAESQMRAEWGGEFDMNINIMHTLAEQHLPVQETRNAIMNATIQDVRPDGSFGPLHGTKVGNNPDFLKMMVSIAKVENPMVTLSPQAGTTVQSRVERYNEIRTKYMGTKKYTDAVANEFMALAEVMEKAGEIDSAGNVVARK